MHNDPQHMYRRFVTGLGRTVLRYNLHLLVVNHFLAFSRWSGDADTDGLPVRLQYGSANGVRSAVNNPSDADQEHVKTDQSLPVTPEAI